MLRKLMRQVSMQTLPHYIRELLPNGIPGEHCETIEMTDLRTSRTTTRMSVAFLHLKTVSHLFVSSTLILSS